MTVAPKDAGTPSAFSQQFHGNFVGMLDWSQLDDLWLKVRSQPLGWYASQVGEAAAQVSMTAAVLHNFIDEIDALLRHEHQYNYCGIVYADSRAQPTFIKIFDPHHLGSFCSHGGAIIQPRWVLSRVQPEPFEEDAPLPGSRQSWWRRVFASH
ncbi:hypothetical protein [Rhodoferax sp.]|uniref:hypothetical protein n=1 Tax=Rhodoferax sp. TaxID=50421 RepID=UPI00261DC0AA|nr:hypothetical protein [Rhodoferax sp.]MDD5478094.1 hypothetical protein [Rhodoferax sp.]